MQGVSDSIEQYIKQLLMQAPSVDVARNELASRLGCAPSQINYVLTTRFTPNHGYYIQSRRGGGGYIRIVRIDMNKRDYLRMMLSQTMREQLKERDVRSMTDMLCDQRILTLREGRIVKAATSDRALKCLPEERDTYRASIFKQIVLSIAGELDGAEGRNQQNEDV